MCQEDRGKEVFGDVAYSASLLDGSRKWGNRSGIAILEEWRVW